jgi:hypothetical protein
MLANTFRGFASVEASLKSDSGTAATIFVSKSRSKQVLEPFLSRGILASPLGYEYSSRVVFAFACEQRHPWRALEYVSPPNAWQTRSVDHTEWLSTFFGS